MLTLMFMHMYGETVRKKNLFIILFNQFTEIPVVQKEKAIDNRFARTLTGPIARDVSFNGTLVKNMQKNIAEVVWISTSV